MRYRVGVQSKWIYAPGLAWGAHPGSFSVTIRKRKPFLSNLDTCQKKNPWLHLRMPALAFTAPKSRRGLSSEKGFIGVLCRRSRLCFRELFVSARQRPPRPASCDSWPVCGPLLPPALPHRPLPQKTRTRKQIRRSRDPCPWSV